MIRGLVENSFLFHILSDSGHQNKRFFSENSM